MSRQHRRRADAFDTFLQVFWERECEGRPQSLAPYAALWPEIEGRIENELRAVRKLEPHPEDRSDLRENTP